MSFRAYFSICLAASAIITVIIGRIYSIHIYNRQWRARISRNQQVRAKIGTRLHDGTVKAINLTNSTCTVRLSVNRMDVYGIPIKNIYPAKFGK